jgi:hypothetical protein
MVMDIKRDDSLRTFFNGSGDLYMNDNIEKYMATFDEHTKQRFGILYDLILDSTSKVVEEKLWAKLPSIYCGNNYVRLIPFKDHINIEAKGMMAYQDKLKGYRFTPKGMLQIGHTQEIPRETLRLIFKDSLETK